MELQPIQSKNPYYDYPERLNGYVEIWGDYPKLEAGFPL